MNLGIAFVDVIAACLFFAAAVITLLTTRMTVQRTPVWGYMTAVFLIMAVERGTNALEWGGGEQFGWLDDVQGYLKVVAVLLLLAIVVSFGRRLRQAHREEPPEH